MINSILLKPVNLKVMGQSSIELFATKKQGCICQPNNACIEQTN